MDVVGLKIGGGVEGIWGCPPCLGVEGLWLVSLVLFGSLVGVLFYYMR